MVDGIEKINPIGSDLNIKISENIKIKSRKTSKRQKAKYFTEVFEKRKEKINEKIDNKSYAKYKNGRRIK